MAIGWVLGIIYRKDRNMERMAVKFIDFRVFIDPSPRGMEFTLVSLAASKITGYCGHIVSDGIPCGKH